MLNMLLTRSALRPSMRMTARMAPTLRASSRRCVQPSLQAMLFAHGAYDPRKNRSNQPVPPPARVDELLKENAALKAEVAALKDKLAKVKPGMVATFKKYGIPFVLWWSALYVTGGVGFYVAFETGLVNGDQAINFIMSLGLDRIIDPTRLNPQHGYIALAFILNEAIESLRFPIAIATMPLVTRVLGRNKKVEKEEAK